MSKKFAVIDTETTWSDEVMSIGVVIASEEDFKPLSSNYWIITEAAKKGGMYSRTLEIPGIPSIRTDREGALSQMRAYLYENEVTDLLAYNANFDKRHLPEFKDFTWRDILKLAAYKQHNPAIPECADCCGTGRLKRNYRVECILEMFGEVDYREMHNALTDSEDELRIMGYLAKSVGEYPEI